MIREAAADDAAAMCAVYNPYVETTSITFEEEPVSEADMRERIAAVQPTLPWLVAENSAGVVIGYAYAARWKARTAYRFSVETTIYLAPHAAGHGLGRTLYGALLAELATRNIHVAIAGIALPNPASIALHEKLGFTKVAHFPQIGWKLGAWIDVGYWERQL